ncbi:MAG: nucleotide exchange factor GrpE [Gomphosphaeria aponina SAG 52.96 = DSM 107014]|uniref:Protein GrpE n=1 Tax=Gomphosphaeria aponina SAG 52.96 = DSM 107014 TaxID=1521640 RepID=A0A941GVX4_9CHRO|nr:nucleotide exchange factor GrpE [Gomphosphaeria aponina SAG 52.96 = DSM 107014]
MIDNEKQLETTSEAQEETSAVPDQGENKDFDQEQGSLAAGTESESSATETQTTTDESSSPSSAADEGENQPEESAAAKELDSVESLQQEIAALHEKLEQAENLQVQYARMAADFENFRKRTLKEREILEQQVKRNTINEILPVVDNFERARTQIKPANEGEMAIHKSYQGVYKNLVDSLKRIGVAAMRPEGQPFDPNYHEAMLREPTNEYPEDTVIEQLVRGYTLGDQVLRHAMVKVAAPSEAVTSSEEENVAAPAEENN